MGSESCIFCRIVSGQIPSLKIYEDRMVLAFLDIGPVSDGHCLVIPREHFEQMHDCPTEVLTALSSCVGRLALSVVSVMNADGYNVLCNNGRAAGQLVEHVHFHVIPRSNGDGVFAHWPAYKYPEGKAAVIAEKISKKM